MDGARRETRKIAARRRGLRIVLWFVVLFWLAQVLGGVVLDYVWIRPRFPQQADMYARLASRQPTPEIVFCGSSRFEGEIMCGVMDEELRHAFGDQAPHTFNAALPAGDPIVFDRILDDMFRKLRHAKLMVVEVSPETLTRRTNWLADHALNVLDWRDVPEAIPALLGNGRILYLLRGRLLPLHVHRYHIRREAVALLTSLFRPASSHPRPGNAEVPSLLEIDAEPPVLTPEARAAMEGGYELVARQVSDYGVGGMAARRLERLLDRCRSVGVEVLLVGVPVSSPHRRAYTPEVNAQFLAYVHELTQRYGCAYTDWRDRLLDNYFVDRHHVNPQGGAYFSKKFAEMVLVPWWRERQHSGTFVRAYP